jgi:hypothetical protein
MAEGSPVCCIEFLPEVASTTITTKRAIASVKRINVKLDNMWPPWWARRLDHP